LRHVLPNWPSVSICPCVSTFSPAFDALLTFTPQRLELRWSHQPKTAPLYAEFVGGEFGYARRRNRFGSLYQAVGLRGGHRPRVVDATAGLGRDAFRMAYAGCDVTAVERSPVLFALLEDGVTRALSDPEIRERLDNRLRLVHADARAFLKNLPPDRAPDVVYLDPMYPARKKSALVKHEMRLLRGIVGDDLDSNELFELARRIARDRVVVKRMRLAEPLEPSPSHSCHDKTTRYDVYMKGQSP
jgi:16S rRNA (guanine1516-N2)-methyltransferase